LMYPSSSDDDFASTYADSTLVGESPPAEHLFMSPVGYYGTTVPSFPAAEASSPIPSRPYFIDSSDLSGSHENNTMSGSWVSELNIGAQVVRDFIPDVYPDGTYSLNTYDSLEFQTLREHNLHSAFSDRFM